MDIQRDHAKNQIVNSLLPAVLLEGNEPVRMKLNERKAQLVTRQEDHLFIRVPGENWNFPLYPEFEMEFFMFEKEEPIIFELDRNQITKAFR